MSRKIGSDGIYVNRSIIYFFPMLGLSMGYPKSTFKDNMLKGVFIKNDDYPDLQERLFLWFKEIADRRFMLFEQSLTRVPVFDFSYKPDRNHKIFVFKIPQEYKREYDELIKSRYSKVSENYKKAIVKFNEYDVKRGIGTNIVNILNKDESQYKLIENKINEGLPEEQWTKIPRDQEIGSLLEEVMEQETFSEDLKIKETINN